jgi:hypothetical protein
MTRSDSGTAPLHETGVEPLLRDPIATIVRMSLMACSFSTVCLMSNARDLASSETPKTYDSGIETSPDKKPVQGLFPKALYRIYVH